MTDRSVAGPAAPALRRRAPRRSAAFTPWAHAGDVGATICALVGTGHSPLSAAGVRWLLGSVMVAAVGWTTRRRRPWQTPAGGRIRRDELLSAGTALLSGLWWLAVLERLVPVEEPSTLGVVVIITVVWWASQASVLASDPLAFVAFSAALTSALMVLVHAPRSSWSDAAGLIPLLLVAVGASYLDRRWVWARARDSEIEREAASLALEHAFDGMTDGVVVTFEGRVIRGNPALWSMLGHEHAPSGPTLLADLLGLDAGLLVAGRAQRLIVPGVSGGRRPIRMEGSRSPSTAGLVIWAFRDLTEELERERQLRDLAERDELTGLGNRRSMNDRLGQLVASADDLAVLMVDVDNFKLINDTYGHDAGDRVLQRLGQLLVQVAGPGGLAARLGGDEFVVLLSGRAAGERAEELARRLMTERVGVARPDGREIRATLSVGVAVRTPLTDGLTPSDLLRRADLAMYDAKRAGRGAVSGGPMSG